MKQTILTVLMLSATILSANAQPERNLSVNDISSIQENLKKQEADIETLKARLDGQQFLLIEQIDSIGKLNYQVKKLKDELGNYQSDISQLENTLNDTIIENQRAAEARLTDNLKNTSDMIESTIEQNKRYIATALANVQDNRFYWIATTLIVFFFGALVYWVLKKRIVRNRIDLEVQIANTRAFLEEENLKLDSNLVELLETQLKTHQQESKATATTPSDTVDHSLALKVADEVVRMEKNISRMDADIKGLKPLEKGIERIRANFAANGYEMLSLLNKEYREGMNIDVVNFVEDKTLDSDKNIISRIIKPQVNFDGVLIQRAQVEVSQN